MPKLPSILLWHNPRSLSHAVCRSFLSRGDFNKVIVSPQLHASYGDLEMTEGLRAHIQRMRKEGYPASMPEVWAYLAKHEPFVSKDSVSNFFYSGEEWSLQSQAPYLKKYDNHVFLMREPTTMFTSFWNVVSRDERLSWEAPRKFAGRCYDEMLQVYEFLRALGKHPLILTAEELTEQPEATLRALCEKIGIPFTEKMLSWSKGNPPEWERTAWLTSGVWTESLSDSTGFTPKATKKVYPLDLPKEVYEDTVATQLPAYDRLMQYKRQHIA